MPAFYRSRAQNSRRVQSAPLMITELTIESLDQEGRGVAHADGKVVFVEGALPGERVDAEILKRKPSYDIARAVTIHRASAAPCHAALPALRRMRRLHAAARGRIAADRRQAARARGRAAADRARARRHAAAADRRAGLGLPLSRAAVGARRPEERRRAGRLPRAQVELTSPTCASATSFRAKISALLPPLRTLVESLSIRTRLPQIEVAVGERLTPATLVRRDAADNRSSIAVDVGGQRADRLCAGAAHPRAADRRRRGEARRIRRRARRRVLAAARRPGHGHAVSSAGRHARLHAAGVRRRAAVRADRFHAGQFGDQPRTGAPGVAIARSAHRASASPISSAASATSRCRSRGAARRSIGVEGSKALVARAQGERRHATALPTARAFVCANLFTATADTLAPLGRLDRALIDPPREGAIELVKALPHRDDERALKRIVYVSCNPAHARPRRGRARARARLPPRRRGRRQHVPAHGARRIDGGVRYACDRSDERTPAVSRMRVEPKHRVGGGVTSAALPHHRTCGSASGGS